MDSTELANEVYLREKAAVYENEYYPKLCKLKRATDLLEKIEEKKRKIDERWLGYSDSVCDSYDCLMDSSSDRNYGSLILYYQEVWISSFVVILIIKH